MSPAQQVRVYGEEVEGTDADRKHLILAALGCLALGAAAALGWMAWRGAAPETGSPLSHVVAETRGLSEDLAVFRETVRSVETRVQREVVRVRETVRSEVAVLSADALADALNDELAMFRGLFIRPTGGDTDNF